MLLFFFDSTLNFIHRNFEITQFSWANVMMLTNKILEHITVLQHWCKKSWIAMLRALPPTSNLSCNKLVYCWLRKVVAESIDQFYLLQKNLHILRILPAQGKCAWQNVTKRPSIAWLPRNCTQSEVSIHAICKNLICCKTGLNVGSRTRNASFFACLLPTLLSLKDVKTCKWCQAHQNAGFYKTECLGVR